MNKITVATLLFAIATFALVKLASLPSSGPVQALGTAIKSNAAPAIDPTGLSRTAPHTIPTESWNAN